MQLQALFGTLAEQGLFSTIEKERGRKVKEKTGRKVKKEARQKPN